MKIFRILASVAVILVLGAAAAHAQSSVTMEGNCLAKCPGPTLTYRAVATNDTPNLATVNIDVILPTGARFQLHSQFVGQGTTTIQRRFPAPASQPGSCPTTVTLEAELVLSGGTTLTSSDDVELIALN